MGAERTDYRERWREAITKSRDQPNCEALEAVGKVTDWGCIVGPEWFRKYWQTISPTMGLLQESDYDLDDLWSGLNEVLEKPRAVMKFTRK